MGLERAGAVRAGPVGHVRAGAQREEVRDVLRGGGGGPDDPPAEEQRWAGALRVVRRDAAAAGVPVHGPVDVVLAENA